MQGNSDTAAGETKNVEKRTQGALVIESVPTTVPVQLTQRLEQYQNTRSCNLKGWHRSADGKGVDGMLISTRFAEAPQIHYLQHSGQYRKQISFFKEPIWAASMCPNAESPHRSSFLFSKDVGGNEYYQIHYFDLKSGRYTMLTDGKSKNGSTTWSTKGDRFAFNSTRRNNKDHDIWISDLPLSLASDNNDEAQEAPKQEVVLTEGGMWHVLDWSEDDRLLLVMKYISVNESTLHVLDLETKVLTQINPKDEKIAYSGGRFAYGTNNKGIFFASNEDSEFHLLRYYDLGNKRYLPVQTEGGKTPSLTEDIPWDVDSFSLSEKGNRLAFLTNEDGLSQFYVMDFEVSPEGDAITVKSREKINIPVGQAYSLRFHPDGKQIGLVLSTPQTPGDVFVLQLEGEKKHELTRWTFSEVGGLDTSKFVIPELVHYETFDTLEGGEVRKIPAFYYKPPAHKAKEGKFPVMIRIHGGPESQSRPDFIPIIQYYCNELGVASLVPNVRGSSGYGKTYLTLDDGYKREDSVKDIGCLIDWARKQPELDADRIMVNGGSYGGYMVLASMIYFGEKLRAGIERVGISNWVTFLENTADYRKDLRRVEYGDERIPEMREFLLKISPLTNASQINKPMLIAQGANDPRVPLGESEQIVKAIRDNGREVWYIVAMDEGHGFQKKSNVDFYTTSEVMFTQKFLL